MLTDWLTGRLMPDFKTIAIPGQRQGLVGLSPVRVLCQELGLFSKRWSRSMAQVQGRQ
ncbi:MAG: hypothetical protein IPP84_02545 [Propionivibrio sp.]|uniref:hypothetical protein n=1 Tax=Propionivibrio sp. TaxID=2212460 RepID=UPI0025EFE628|nr:hypothetical protein [Propionivibrio sp.]MBL0206864.1 hypothetical protein [Propionivibrio sp.]